MTPQFIGQMGGQPIFVLSEGTTRSQGDDARKNSIAAARAVAATVRSTLGPRGMDKMMIDTIGDISITNDGATILKDMNINHPAAKMCVEVAKTQESEVGDGTTTAVILVGSLLEKAEKLLEQHIHPTIIIRGYQLARPHAVHAIEQLAFSSRQADVLEHVARTAMSGKITEHADLARLVVQAVMQAKTADNIKVEKKATGFLSDTRLIRGMLVDKEVVHHSMPKDIRTARILLLDCPLELKELETSATISLRSPDKRDAFVAAEDRMLSDMAKKIITTGANVVLCQKGIDETIQSALAHANIIAARRVKKSDMDLLAKATGARVSSSLDDISSKDVGTAGRVHEVKFGDDRMLEIEDCANPQAVTIIVRGSSEQLVNEAERALEDAIRGAASVLTEGTVLPGGGTPEVVAARAVRLAAEGRKGKEQLAMHAFADALEAIPLTLAENGGWDPIEKIAALRSQQKMGLDVYTGEVCDMRQRGILEPLKTTKQALTGAIEAAEMILRIDDVMVAARASPGPMH